MKHLFIFFSVLIAAGASAQEVVRLSLQQAQQYAVDHAYSVQNKSIEVEKARKIYLENVARGLPQVFANGNYTYNIERQAFIAELQPGQIGLLQIGAPYAALGTLAAEQLLFDGSYIIAVLASEVLKESAQNDLEKSKIDIREQVARAYHLVLVSRRTLEIIEEDIKFLNQSLTETSKLFEAGFVEEQDKDQLEILVSNLLNNRVFAQKQGEIAMMLLKINLGLTLDKSVELTDNIEDLLQFVETAQVLLADPFQTNANVDFRNLLIREKGQTLNLKNEKWQYAPKLKAFYNLNYSVNSVNPNPFQGEEGEQVDVRWQALGVGVSVPILTGGSRAARVQQARLQLEQVEIAKIQLSDNLQLQYEQARAEFEYALNSYQTQRRNVELAKKIRDRTMKKYQEGLSGSLDLTQAENQYQESLRMLINAANSVLDKKVSLEKILGRYND